MKACSGSASDLLRTPTSALLCPFAAAATARQGVSSAYSLTSNLQDSESLLMSSSTSENLMSLMHSI